MTWIDFLLTNLNLGGKGEDEMGKEEEKDAGKGLGSIAFFIAWVCTGCNIVILHFSNGWPQGCDCRFSKVLGVNVINKNLGGVV